MDSNIGSRNDHAHRLSAVVYVLRTLGRDVHCDSGRLRLTFAAIGAT
jgi:hypothetical protein